MANPNHENEFGYIVLSFGEQSDYQSQVFKVLKPFSFADISVELMDAWLSGKEKTYGRDTPYPDEVIAWLKRNGFIGDSDKLKEVYLGGYRFYSGEIHPELAQTVFMPRVTDKGN